MMCTSGPPYFRVVWARGGVVEGSGFVFIGAQVRFLGAYINTSRGVMKMERTIVMQAKYL